MGRLDTCYAPVRRSPAICASTNPAAPRLACVKPVASVHPEPGSNSSSYSIVKNGINPDSSLTRWRMSRTALSISLSDIDGSLAGAYLTPARTCFLYYNLCLCKSLKERPPKRESNRVPTDQKRRPSLICGCKGTTFLKNNKTSYNFFTTNRQLLNYIHYILYTHT